MCRVGGLSRPEDADNGLAAPDIQTPPVPHQPVSPAAPFEAVDIAHVRFARRILRTNVPPQDLDDLRALGKPYRAAPVAVLLAGSGWLEVRMLLCQHKLHLETDFCRIVEDRQHEAVLQVEVLKARKLRVRSPAVLGIIRNGQLGSALPRFVDAPVGPVLAPFGPGPSLTSRPDCGGSSVKIAFKPAAARAAEATQAAPRAVRDPVCKSPKGASSGAAGRNRR